jgi:hypothetical protein
MAAPGMYQVFQPGTITDGWMIAGLAMMGIPPTGEIPVEKAIQLGFLKPGENGPLMTEGVPGGLPALTTGAGESNKQFTVEGQTPAVDPKAVRQALLDTATAKGRTGVNEAFTKYGLDPAKYGSQIEGRIASTIAGIPGTQGDNFDTYFTGLGDRLLGDLENPYRNTAKDAFNKKMPKDWVPGTSDDAFIESILGEQRGEADTYVKNMLSRGLINEQGSTAAYKELDRQGDLARPQLSEIGTGLINTGEGNIDAEQAKRLSAYDTLKFDQPYNVDTDYGSLNQMATDFISSLGQGLRTGIGTKKYFDTSSLGALAGASQGGDTAAPVVNKSGGGGQQAATAPGYVPEEDKTGQELLF